MLLIESGGRSFSDPWVCVFLVPQEVFDPSHKPTRPSCSLDVRTVVISRFNRHSNVMVTRASTTPAIYRENFWGDESFDNRRGDDVMRGSPLVRLHVFRTGEKQIPGEYIWKFQGEETDTAEPNMFSQ